MDTGNEEKPERGYSDIDDEDDSRMSADRSAVKPSIMDRLHKMQDRAKAHGNDALRPQKKQEQEI